MKLFTLLFFFISISMMAETDFEKAEKLYQQEKWEQAKTLFENFLKQNPNNPKTIEYLGDIAGHQKKWDEALKYYGALKTQFSKNANYCYKWAGSLGMKAKESNKFRALSMLDDVENGFLTAAKLDANHIDSRWALVVYYMEVPGILGGSERKALKYSAELTKISSVDGLLSKGYIAEYNKNYKEAEKNYSAAYEIGKSATTYQKLYNLYFNKLKDKAKAQKLKAQFEM